jgi:hypothetical protein
MTKYSVEEKTGRLEEQREKRKLALYQQFGRHAERFTGEGQQSLFDAEEGGGTEGSGNKGI